MVKINLKTQLVKTLYGSREPVSGSHNQGDRVINTKPTTGGYAGWVCVESGSPGVWKGFGLIEE